MKIQNKKFANEDIVFHEVGLVTGDGEGIFDIPNDAVALKVISGISGWSKIVETPEGDVRKQVTKEKDGKKSNDKAKKDSTEKDKEPSEKVEGKLEKGEEKPEEANAESGKEGE